MWQAVPASWSVCAEAESPLSLCPSSSLLLSAYYLVLVWAPRIFPLLLCLPLSNKITANCWPRYSLPCSMGCRSDSDLILSLLPDVCILWNLLGPFSLGLSLNGILLCWAEASPATSAGLSWLLGACLVPLGLGKVAGLGGGEFGCSHNVERYPMAGFVQGFQEKFPNAICCPKEVAWIFWNTLWVKFHYQQAEKTIWVSKPFWAWNYSVGFSSYFSDF